MGGACSIYETYENNACTILVGNPDDMRPLGTDRQTRGLCSKWYRMCVRIGSSGRLTVISCLPERLLACQRGLCFMELHSSYN